MRRLSARQAAGTAAVIVLGLLPSCTATTPVQTAPSNPSTTPTTAAAAGPSDRPTGQPTSQTPTPRPSLAVTLEPGFTEPPATEQPLTTPWPATHEPAGPSPFKLVDDFLGPDERVSSITAGGPGYVSVGWRVLSGDGCSEGRVWTSVDGRNWISQPIEMPNSYLELVVAFKDAFYAFGHELDTCARIGPAMVWRSADGVAWTQTSAPTEATGHWMDVVATADRLIAISASLGRARTWLSSDGENWRRPERNSPSRYGIEAFGHTVVAAGGTYDNHVGLAPDVSLDDGETWQQVAAESDYEFRTQFAAGNDVLLAATRACCGLPAVDVGVPLTTRDGITWSGTEAPHLSPADSAVSVPGGFLTLSNDGSTALSADGKNWFSGPPMRLLADNERYLGAATAGATGVLVASSDYYNAMEYEIHLWFAPIDAFDLSRWTNPVPLAQHVEVGRTYRAPIGFCPYSIRMGGQVWMPTTGVSLEPFTGEDIGTVTLVRADHAIFTAPDGSTIPLEPVHPVPLDPDPGC